jgi:hypothetical protein
VGIAAKFLPLAVALGLLTGLPRLSGAETLRADRIVLDVPDGGMTQSGPAESVSTFKHRSFHVTVTAEVRGAPYYEYWQKSCTPAKLASDAEAVYQLGRLARTDQYLYSKILRFPNHGISTPKGSWLEHCLLFRSGDLAAKVSIDLPKSALEKSEITAAEIEKIFASARLTDASVEDRGTRDPRLTLEMPGDIVPTGLPSFTVRFTHNRLPFGINVTLSDAKRYETAKLLNKISARRWKVGSLSRTDEHFYYFLWPDPYPDFVLGFREAGVTVQIGVGLSKSSPDKGDIAVKDIEHMLATARMTPARPDNK